ncbi:hypothetical protein [Enterobacter sp. KBR-315C3_2022]|jgi:hypothetical protein|uniref:hypothetical protein n=1 Tax=Enterobacter sp. KBR-315C3_2022 TaxID=3242494 RepID=UPI003527997E
MYSYEQVEAIKTNLEWIVNQSSVNHPFPSNADKRTLLSLLELIQAYEILLELIKEFGISVIDSDVAEGLSFTETFITKIKSRTHAM